MYTWYAVILNLFYFHLALQQYPNRICGCSCPFLSLQNRNFPRKNPYGCSNSVKCNEPKVPSLYITLNTCRQARVKIMISSLFHLEFQESCFLNKVVTKNLNTPNTDEDIFSIEWSCICLQARFTWETTSRLRGTPTGIPVVWTLWWVFGFDNMLIDRLSKCLVDSMLTWSCCVDEHCHSFDDQCIAASLSIVGYSLILLK